MTCKFSSLTKVFRSVGGRVLVLLLCLCLSLYSSLPVNAAAVTTYSRRFMMDSSWTNFDSGQGWRLLAASYSRVGTTIYFQTPTTPPATEFVNGNNFTVSLTALTRSQYTSTGNPRPVELSCPVLGSRFNTTECTTETSEQVYGNYHFMIWQFNINGTIGTVADSDILDVVMDIKNFSENDADLWFIPPVAAFGEGSFSAIRNLVAATQSLQQLTSNIANALTNTNNYLSAIQSVLNTINTKMDSASVAGVISQQQITNNKLDALQSSVESQTEQQQDQYEAEKQEESEREEQGNDDADELAGTFSFSLINPFALFADVFTDGSACVNIPYLSRLVGSTDTTLCPWFPGWVRSMLTPVISIVSGFFLFSYVWRWINSDSERTVDF